MSISPLTLRRISAISTGCCLGLGILSLATWLTKGGTQEMPWLLQPGDAVCFALLAASLWLLRLPDAPRWQQWVGHTLAIAVIVSCSIGIATEGWPWGAATGSNPKSDWSGWLSYLHLHSVSSSIPLLIAAGAVISFALDRKYWFGLSIWLSLTVLDFALFTLMDLAMATWVLPVPPIHSVALVCMAVALIFARFDGASWSHLRQTPALATLAFALVFLGLAAPLIAYLFVSWWLLQSQPELHDTALFLITFYAASILGGLTFVLRSMDGLDLRRRDAETARDLLLARLQQQAANLEILVGERTSELQKSTERLDLALRAGNFGVWDWDMISKRVFWDQRQCTLYGFTPEQFDGTTGAWLQRLHPVDRQSTQVQIGRALAAGEGFDCTFRIMLPDGVERHIHSVGVLRRDTSGRVTRVVGIDRDVTEQHAHARELAMLNDRLQLAIKATGYGIWEMDLQTKHMIWDDRMLEIYGITRTAFTGAVSEWHDRVLPEDAARDDEAITAAIAGKTPIYESAFRIRRPNGSVRHVEALGIVQYDQNGHPYRLVGLDRDVTEATELREALRISQERWRLALSGSNDAVWDHDIVSGQTYRDSRFFEMLGRSPDEIKMRHVWQVFGHPEDIVRIEKALEEHFAGRSSIYNIEYRLRHANGHWVWINDRGKIVDRDNSGRPTRMVGTQSDITPRKELEERLRHGEEMSLQLSRLAHIGAWEWDISTSRLTWSPEMFRIHEVELGYEPTLEKWFSFYPAEARATITAAIDHAIQAGTGFDLELPFVNARGHKLWVRVLGRAQQQNGRVTRLSGAFQDITGRRDAEEMRRHLEGQLFQAQKMETLGTLAGGIAHDFNNLLTGILGYQDLALDTLPEGDSARNYLGAARDASLRARELVDQILTFSRQADSEKVPVNLVQVIDDARRFLRATVPATVRIEVNTAAPCRRVLADATQVHQVLLNLGSNASHAMRATGGVMRLTLSEVEIDNEAATTLSNITPGNYARVDFSDTGHGMDEETRKRIFDPFFTTKEVGQGTGLGLSVVHGILQAHHGAISVQSAPGQGSTFTLYLPIAIQESNEATPAQDIAPRGKGELIAVVDDEDIVRSFAQMALEKIGYRVAAFDSPTQCLEVLSRNASDYSALLTDQTMPVMKGIELATELRVFAPDLPIVIMSGYFSRISPEKLAQIGHVALLSKPFTNDELGRTMHRAITEESTKA